MRTLRVFISSPGDVADERQRALGVIERVQRWHRDRVTLQPIFWEHQPLSADADFQSGIEAMGSADVAAFLFWSRLGTPLSERFRLEDGRLPTGTEWEFVQALSSFVATGRPKILAYRRKGAPSLSLDAADAAQREAREQWRAVGEFWHRHFESESGAPRRASHSYSTPAEFAERFEKHLLAIVSGLVRPGLPASSTHPSSTTLAPFRGLLVYEFEHAPIFFGRSRAIQGLLQALRDQVAARRAFVLVMGMSGSGKSSLVRAGLLPLLTSAEVVEPGAGRGPVRRAVMRPGAGSDPFESLAGALLGEEAFGSEGRDSTAVGDLARALRAGPEAAVAVVHRELARDGSSAGVGEGRLVLVVDQFEELFAAERVPPSVAHAFARVLDGLAREGRTWVLATLRADFYGRTAELPGLVALKEGAGHFDLLPPTGSEIGDIIRQPAHAAGLEFGVDAHGTPLDVILEDAAVRSPGALPLLAFTLERLYEQRRDGVLTHEAYVAMGGLEGAIAARAFEVHRALGPDARASLGRVLGSLVDVTVGAEGAVTRRRPSVDALTGSAAMRGLVDEFVRARLLVVDRSSTGLAVLDVAHEALFQRWPELHDWIERNRSLLQVRSHVAREAAHWSLRGRDASLLLPEGLALQDGERLLAAAAAVEIDATTRDYVRASLGAVEQRHLASVKAAALRRRAKALVLGAVVVAALGVGGAWMYREKRSADRIQALNVNLEAMLALGTELQEEPRTARVLEKVSQVAADLVQADRVSVYAFDDESKELWTIVAPGVDGVIRLPLGKGIAGTVGRTLETINLADAYDFKDFDPATDRRTGYRTRTVLCMALTDPCSVPPLVGVIQALNRRDGRPFDGTDERLLRALAGQAAVILAARPRTIGR